MPKVKYIHKRFNSSTLEIIDKAASIIKEYQAQGFSLTLRQLYYQFVSRDFLSNSDKEYKRLGNIINEARLSGLIDWEAIEDRTRFLRGMNSWDDPEEIVRNASYTFHMDRWNNQKYRPEVWIEKDALVGVISRICSKYDIDYFSCRGYVSQSEMWRAARRLVRYAKDGRTPIIFHFGDHDPSGIDMTRDIKERLDMFMQDEPFTVKRLALNLNQIRKYNPPPNPAKVTDSRFEQYVKKYGRQSWELDALEPKVLAGLIESEVRPLITTTKWKKVEKIENTYKAQILEMSKQF